MTRFSGITVLDNDAKDIQITVDIPSGFTIPPGVVDTLPGFFMQFDVANTLEFLNPSDDVNYCYGLVLPPVINIGLPGGAIVNFAPTIDNFICAQPGS